MQKYVCQKYNAAYLPCDLNLKVGISRNARDNIRPIHGVRLKAENGTSGWYIWVGDFSDDPEFFVPLHGVHLETWLPLVMPYLGLPVGWRFLISEDYEDVWCDESIK